jgi:hypothetical protein
VYFGSATKDDPCNYPLQGTCSISDYLKAYSFNAGGSGVLSSVPTSHTPEQFSWPAPNLSVSSNGSTNGILWATDFNNGGSAILRAYDATNLGTEFYTSNSTRDQAGRAVKFSAPTIANGKVYIGEGYANGANGGLEVYGLLSSGPSCTATLACHNYQSAVLAQLTISCTKFANWISTSAEACTPNTNYPNNTLCSGYSSGPTGILTSSSTTAAVPPGNVSGPPNWCNYKYTIGTANYVVNDITAK